MVCVGVPFKCGYGGVVSYCSLKHYRIYNKISGIKLVSLYSTIKMMHGPINIRFIFANLVIIPRLPFVLL